MEDVREQPGPPGSSIDGCKATDELPVISMAFPHAAASGTDRETTRYLSAATQLDIEYAKSVVDRVMNEKFRALAPTFGIDVPVVAMWAMKALRTRAHRDYFLTILLAALIAFSALLFFWIWALILISMVLIAAWLAVCWEYWERIHDTVIGKMLRDRFDPGDAPPPPREADRDRLRQVAKHRDGNLVVFSGHSAFIGSGKTVYRQHLLLDVSRGKDAEDGMPRDPDHFSSQDLHTTLVEAFNHETGLAKKLQNISVRERLFVNGLHVKNNIHLLPDPLNSPPASVSADLLVDGAVHPSPDARTYVCVEMPGWQGQLVVTLFIRAVYVGSFLYVEWTFRALPPLKKKFLAIDNYYERPLGLQLRDSLVFGVRITIPALLRSPFQAIRSYLKPRILQHRRSHQAREIEKGYIFDYGAQRSIREDACGIQRQHYFLARDETMYILLAERTLIRTVGDFLREHKVDLGQFDDQVKIIIDHSINIGTIDHSAGVVIGNNSSATVQGVPGGTQ